MATNGIPIVLLYLGFMHCMGTKDDPRYYVPNEAWRKEPLFDTDKATMYSVISSMEIMIGHSTVLSINGPSV